MLSIRKYKKGYTVSEEEVPTNQANPNLADNDAEQDADLIDSNLSSESERTHAEVQTAVSAFQKQYGEMQRDISKTLGSGYVPGDEYENIQAKRKLADDEYEELMEKFSATMRKEVELKRSSYENDFLATLSFEQRQVIERQVEEIYSGNPLWHGTGRFRYASIGDSKYEGINDDTDVTEVLLKILQEGIVPAYDPYAEQSVGTQKSISLTKQRMLARVISDTRLAEGDELEFSYGSTLYWHSLFLRQEKLEEFLQGKPSRVKQVQSWISDINNETIVEDDSDVIAALSQTHSTIKGNFPVIIGIDPGKITIKDIEAIGISTEYEVRATGSIQVDAFTHIEVPWQNLEETKALLKELSIDLLVIPIEEGERWMSYHSV